MKTDGVMIVHPNAKLVGENQLEKKDARGALIFADMVNIAKNQGSGSYKYWWDDKGTVKPKVSYIISIPEWNWLAGSGVFVDVVEQQAMDVVQRLLMVAGVCLVIAVLISYTIGRSITGPITLLNSCMQKLAGGNLEINVGMEERRDEVGAMAKTVKVFQENAKQVERMKSQQAEMERKSAEETRRVMIQMADDFEKSVGQVVSIVASAATELQANAKNLSKASDQTDHQSSAVAAASEEASAGVQTVASAAEEMAASIGEINRQVVESTQVTQGAVSEVKRTDSTVSSLADAAAQIGDVVKLIQDIAEQTNLLALNATIEAARAGDAGKGFAVVASEVKNLANQTAKATEEISKKIVMVQNVSGESVEAIRGIGKTIERISTITTAISSAIQQQTAATREISHNVQQASAGTKEVSTNIVKVTQAATESRMAAGEVLQAADELSRQAEQLRGDISKFLNKVREG
jgi:methyl-accepting chemotaxis protein